MAAKLGDRVLAWWPAKQDWFYPGVVCGVRGSSLEIQFDDGGRAEVPAEEVAEFSIVPGDRVFGNWKGGGAYYPGTVSEITAHAIHIDYDDGDKEVTSASLVRVDRDDIPL